MATKKTSKTTAGKKNTPATTKKGTTDLAKFDYGEDAGAGYENQTRDDIAMPFLTVLQGLSPQVQKDGVEDAKPGLLFNTVTEELAENLTFIPSCTKHVFVAWRPDRGGYAGELEINDPLVAKAKADAKSFNELKLDDGNDLVETYYIFGVLTDGEEALGFITIAFDSSKIKVYKKFNTRLQTYMLKTKDGKVKPPMFAHHCRIGVTQETNTKGTFYNFLLGPAEKDIASSLLQPNDPRYQSAAECRELVQSGIAAPAYDSVDRERTDEADADTPF